MIYWSQNPVPVNGIMYENNRPFILPRQPSQHDARAVESTAYALMVRLARDGVGDFEERVVTWLNTMRMVEGGFVSVFVSFQFVSHTPARNFLKHYHSNLFWP